MKKLNGIIAELEKRCYQQYDDETLNDKIQNMIMEKTQEISTQPSIQGNAGIPVFFPR